MTNDEQSTAIPGIVPGQLCYLQIPAVDITTSARFYERVFGWRVAPPESGFEAPALIGQWVTDRPAAPDAGAVGWIQVEDVRRALAEVERAGGVLREAPITDGPRLLASFTDPAGNLIGIVQRGHDTTRRRRQPARPLNRTMPPCTVIPQLAYDDVPAAIDWLCDKFGFAERWRAGDHRAQLNFGNGTIAITEPRTSKVLPGRQSLLVRVADARAHHDLARSRGATIIQEPSDYPYGERQYTAQDLGGHHWTFSESIADLAPEDWGGTSGPELDREQATVLPAASAISAPSPTLSVMLIVPVAEAAIAWYKKALGAAELWNLGGVAGLEIDGAPFFIHEVNPHNPAEDSPNRLGITSTRIEVFVDDPDALIKRAIAAGAAAGSELTDHQLPWGTHRQGGFRDPFGHNWSIGDRSPLRTATLTVDDSRFDRATDI